jgi:NADH-quinone oxidoreductase subunit G
MNKGAGLYFHPMADKTVEGFGKKGKNIETIENTVGSEEAILYFILDLFGEQLPQDTIDYLATFKETKTKTITETIKEKITEMVVDTQTGEEKEVTKMVPKKIETQVEYEYTKLLELIGSSEDLLETIDSMRSGKDTFSLVIGEDCITHKQNVNLAKLCGLIEKYTQFKVVIIPTQTNTLGVSLLCELDDEIGTKVFGYNTKATFEISALGDGNLDMPALNQQEGTFTNINKNIVPTNAALPYNGYTLNDIANEILELKDLDFKENTIDYTKDIFDGIEFDSLTNDFNNDGTENRGYTLKTTNTSSNDEVSQISKVDTLNDTIIYKANPINQFNEFTAIASQFKDDKVALFVSNDLLATLDCESGDIVNIEANGTSLELEIILDVQLGGNIGYVPYFVKEIASCKLFDGYRFNTAKINKTQKKV